MIWAVAWLLALTGAAAAQCRPLPSSSVPAADHRMRTLHFPSDTIWARFSAGGRRLLVVTESQTAYLFSLAHWTSPVPAASTPAAKLRR